MPYLVAHALQFAAGQELPHALRGESKNARGLRRRVGEILGMLGEAHGPKKNLYSHERRFSCSGGTSSPSTRPSEAPTADSRGSGVASKRRLSSPSSCSARSLSARSR